jgi:hypothetical protein
VESGLRLQQNELGVSFVGVVSSAFDRFSFSSEGVSNELLLLVSVEEHFWIFDFAYTRSGGDVIRGRSLHEVIDVFPALDGCESLIVEQELNERGV